MFRQLIAVGIMAWGGAPTLAAAPTPPASERFLAAENVETPSFRKHVLPLLGRLGCNGRACHGSFQGQGGFRLSLFGYDFQQDHDALLGKALASASPGKGKPPPAEVRTRPRVDVKDPRASLILEKPTLT